MSEFEKKLLKTIENIVQNQMNKLVAKIEQRLFEKIDLSKTYPEQLKTGEAAKMLKIHKTTLVKRKNSSFYKENLHFKRNGSIILWNRDALLKKEQK